MSGIPIHVQDPIKAANMQADPQDVDPSAPDIYAQAPTSTTRASRGDATADLGALVPTPTKTLASPDSQPPLPEPRAVPRPGAVPQYISSTTTTTRDSLPPPPKPGERLQPPEFYAPTQAKHIPPPQAYTSPDPPTRATPPASSTSTSTTPSSQPITLPPKLPINASSTQSGLDHPPGYVQNPYASDMTPEQRFAVQQEKHGDPSDMSTSLGYTPNRSRTGSTSGVINEAKKWASEVGGQLNEKGGQLAEQFGEIHGKFWESVQGRK